MGVFHFQIFTYDFSLFTKAKKFCVELLQKGQDYINNYYIYLQELERSRSNKIKKLLNIYYKEIKLCAYLTPYEIQLYFENQILVTTLYIVGGVL